MELVYHIQGFLAIDWKNIVAKVRTLWYNGEAKGDFRAVRAKIIDIWRKSVHDLGGEKGLERGIFAEYSKNLVRFLLTFAETTHPREGTETVRDQALKELDTGSCIDRIVWDYLHDGAVIDESGAIIHKYKGIAQGFAVSPFLANYILRDIDEAISGLDVLYYRYSDDILILGRDFERAQSLLYNMLAQKGLTINPKKVTPIDVDAWFTFLGFKIRGSEITFSEDTVKRLKRSVRCLTRTRKGQPLKSEAVLRRAIRQLNRDLYVAYLVNDREFGWAEYMFSTVNVLEDVEALDRYIKDHLRHLYTGRWNSYGNYSKVPNDMLRRCGYVSMVHLFKLYRISRPLYRNEVRMRMA